MWDAQLARRPLTGLGAADSHGKYGLDHALALKLVQTHVLVRERTRAAVLDALRAGRCYVTLEQFAPATFFAFSVTTPTQRHLIGATAPWEAGSRVDVRLPSPSPSDDRTGRCSFPGTGRGRR